MRAPFSTEHGASVVEPDAFSSLRLLEQGLKCFQHHLDSEGAAFFKQAREQLLPYQVQLGTVLDALNAAIANHLDAQQMLHEASKRFTEAYAEQQLQIARLQKAISRLLEDQEKPIQKSAKVHQTLRLLSALPASPQCAEEPQQDNSPDATLPALYVTCLGRFEVRRFHASGQPIDLCANKRGKTILRYLLTRPRQRESMDRLMALLWPDDEADNARHKLQVAISALRRALNEDFVRDAGGGYILCKDEAYQLNPAVVLRSDVDEFLALYQAGAHASSREETIRYYEHACGLYAGPFLPQDLYADWSFAQREELSKHYVTMCHALADFNRKIGRYEHARKWASIILEVNRCDEEAHQLLMCIYAAEGRRSEVLRQYQYCQHVLAEELNVQPMPETQHLLTQLLQGTDAVNSVEVSRP